MNNDIDIINVTNIRQLLNLIQRSSACHLKYSLNLKKAVESENGEEILEELFRCLQYAFLMNFKEKKVYLERILNFVTVFASSFKQTNDEGHQQINPILNKIFNWILKLSTSENDSHRFWSCKLLNQIFGELEELSDELYEQIKESFLERLKDPKAPIRCQAIIALHRLQDPTDQSDPIVTAFCVILETDCNARVRHICLANVGYNRHVLKSVLVRIRDIDHNVRLAAFDKLKSIAKYLKVQEKRLILQCGFNDSSEKVRNFTSTVLLQSWLQSYDNNFIELMKSVRLDACYEDVVLTTHFVESILRALFKSASISDIIKYVTINDEKLIEYENLNWGTVLYYRIAVQYLRQCDGFEDTLNAILPELVHFCCYIKGYCEYAKSKENFDELVYNFTLEQFFRITKDYDLSDSAGRQCLNSLAHYMLQNENLIVDLNQIIVQNLDKTIPTVYDRSVFVCEIISNIIYGEDEVDYEELERKETERKHAISQLQSDILTLQEQEKHFATIEKNYSEAERCRFEIEKKELELTNLREVKERPEQNEKKNDVTTMLHCLGIAEALLRSPTIKEFNPVIASLSSEVINFALIHDSDIVKERALKCYALCCIIDQNTAKYGIHLFSKLILATDLDDIEILITSIKTVVDLLTIYGLSLVEKPEDDEEEGNDGGRGLSDSRCEEVKKVFVGGTCLTDLFQGLAGHLSHENLQVQETATRGICILLLHSRITSPSLLSLIIIKWANPATENERLKQLIGFALTKLTKLQSCRMYFADGILSTIRTLVKAPRGNALKDIDIDNLIKFMVNFCETAVEGRQIHADIAFKICRQMKDRPRIKVNLYFSKMLPMLNVPDGAVADLLTICDELRDVITDNQVLKNVNKFITNLTKNTVDELVPIIEKTEQ